MQQLLRRVLPAVSLLGLWLYQSPELLAQDRTALQGVWSTAFGARDHPEWKIEDHLCQFCPPVARDHLRKLLADPENDRRSLQELGEEATRVAIKHRNSLMTEAARERLKQDNGASNDAIIRCEPPGLILLLQAPLPIAIAVSDDRVVIHHDHWNIMRTIPLTGQSAAQREAPTRLGTATARFDGPTLVVESRNLTGTIAAGIATADGARVVERWTPSPDGARLNLELTIDDPASYREPLVFVRAWARTPNEKILGLPGCEAISGRH